MKASKLNIQHPFWETVSESFGEYMTECRLVSDFFETQHEFYLGTLFDENGNETEDPPTTEQLDEFAKTYQNFSANLHQHLHTIQTQAFTHYHKLYAHHYENPEKSGEPALNIHTIEQHNRYIRQLLNIRITEKKNIRLAIDYQLDSEHGLEFRFIDNQFSGIGGIDET